MKRVTVDEMIDTGEGSAREIAASLTDMQTLNRWFGGEATSLKLLRRVLARTGKTRLRVLETGAGFGEVPIKARNVLEGCGIQLEVTLLDRVEAHLGKGARGVVGDALALPFRDGAFDVVSCCLFAHHLEPSGILSYANEALRVANGAVVINDLVRHPVHYALAWGGRLFYRSRLTRHDAPASVRRAYTVREMSGMLGASRAARVEVTQHYLYRMGAIAWKH
jgi:ubiquinone/menaquinone biosynthesis C-methylase UbiE